MNLNYISLKRYLRYLKFPLLFCAAFLQALLPGKLFHTIHRTRLLFLHLPRVPAGGLVFRKKENVPWGMPRLKNCLSMMLSLQKIRMEKKIYLTFDAGYENGNTSAILDALKNHQAPATFFVVGNFISENQDLIKRMEAEGHTVGNHTMTHPDMSKISTQESFQKELAGVEDIYKEITGKEMTKFYRPPQGIYSTLNLSMAKEMGYHTFFWSLAYVDWYQDNQPDPQEAIAKLTKRIHPGAIVLLHSTSSTNAQILDELLSKWKRWGIRFIL